MKEHSINGCSECTHCVAFTASRGKRYHVLCKRAIKCLLLVLKICSARYVYYSIFVYSISSEYMEELRCAQFASVSL